MINAGVIAREYGKRFSGSKRVFRYTDHRVAQQSPRIGRPRNDNDEDEVVVQIKVSQSSEIQSSLGFMKELIISIPCARCARSSVHYTAISKTTLLHSTLFRIKSEAKKALKEREYLIPTIYIIGTT